MLRTIAISGTPQEANMARLRSFKKTNFQDKETSKLQSNLEIFLKQLENLPIVDAVLLSDIALSSSGVTKVDHKLGRKPIGWIIAGQNANATIWEDTSNTTPTSTLDLNCSSDVTVNLWIF